MYDHISTNGEELTSEEESEKRKITLSKTEDIKNVWMSTALANVQIQATKEVKEENFFLQTKFINRHAKS